MRSKTIRKSPEGKYPFYVGNSASPNAKAQATIAIEASKMMYNLLQLRKSLLVKSSAIQKSFRYLIDMIEWHFYCSDGKYCRISKEAQKLEDSQGGKLFYGQCIFEHTVPMKTICDILLEQSTSPEDCLKLLRKWLLVTVITKEEDGKLNQGYRTSMPDDWDGIDPWARYRKVGIEVDDKTFLNN